MIMEEWQKRVVAEQAELTLKIGNLKAFIDNKLFFFLPDEDQHLLEKQLNIMNQYNVVLLQRLDRINRTVQDT